MGLGNQHTARLRKLSALMTVIRRLALSVAMAALPVLPAMAAVKRPAEDLLTQVEAMARSQRVANVHYDLQFTFLPDSDHYTGRVVLTFDHQGPREDLTLDYAGETIESITVNGQPAAKAHPHGYLHLPGKLLLRQNTVTISFRSAFDKDGSGIMRFVDPADRKTYIHTDFEPYGAHHLFPCFDQPDLKARYRTQVTAPADWVVIGNVAPAGSQVQGKTRMTTFPQTPPISTYLYALHTGQYHSWHDKAGNVPLNLYARASLAKYVDAENLFTITKQGLDFYNRYFDYPYPFGKYDQVFCPELAEGAMENPGAVTIREDAIYRHQVTDSERFDRDDTVVHEMAHMWFGDLVTMRWWNDLWLNESFASYMAALCKASVPPRYGDSWSMFFKLKEWAYDTDEKVTTHPIEARIPDTNAALENFDGITYGKGASVMKQLAHYIGADPFRDGVRTYFKRHAWGNTTLPDFMGALQQHSKHDLKAWTKSWLQTSGLNEISPEIVSKDGKIQSLTIMQASSSGEAVQRPHRTELGIFGQDADGKLRLQRTVPVGYAGAASPVNALQGESVPPLLYANINDQDYAKVRLNGESLRTVEEKLGSIEPPFVRQQIWSSLWSMVRDNRLDVTRFVDLLERHLPGEPDALVVESQLRRLALTFNQYLDPHARKVFGPELEAFAWAQLQRQASGSDAQLLWASTLLQITRTPAGLDRLADLLDGRIEVAGLDVNQDMRWQIIQQLTAAGHAKAEAFFAAEKTRDASDRGLKAIERVLAARPEATTKAKAWERLLKDRKATLAQMEAVMDGFWDLDQEELLEPYVAQFFKAVPQVYRERGTAFGGSFFKRLYPPMAGGHITEATRQLLVRQDLSPELRRKLQETLQEQERRLKLQDAAAKTLALRGRTGNR
jgi:aminopeptidase N